MNRTLGFLFALCVLSVVGCGNDNSGPVGAAHEAIVSTGEVLPDAPIETTVRLDSSPAQRRSAASALGAAQAELDLVAPNWTSMSQADRDRALIDIRCRNTGCPVESTVGGAP